MDKHLIFVIVSEKNVLDVIFHYDLMCDNIVVKLRDCYILVVFY